MNFRISVKTKNSVKQVVFDYIEVFYKRVRQHAKISNQMPADYLMDNRFRQKTMWLKSKLTDTKKIGNCRIGTSN